jgi:hypothetical protein
MEDIEKGEKRERNVETMNIQQDAHGRRRDEPARFSIATTCANATSLTS